jgi:hypothetical protein
LLIFQGGHRVPAHVPTGQLLSEAVDAPSLVSSFAGQTWDVAGRRTGLNVNAQAYAFGWRADGLLASIATSAGSGSFDYNTAGVMTNRNVGNRSTTISSLDGTGLPLSITTKVNLSTKLTETLAWTADGLLNAHSLAREDFTDSRTYDYATLSRRLSAERLNLDATKPVDKQLHLRWRSILRAGRADQSGACIRDCPMERRD